MWVDARSGGFHPCLWFAGGSVFDKLKHFFFFYISPSCVQHLPDLDADEEVAEMTKKKHRELEVGWRSLSRIVFPPIFPARSASVSHFPCVVPLFSHLPCSSTGTMTPAVRVLTDWSPRLIKTKTSQSWWTHDSPTIASTTYTPPRCAAHLFPLCGEWCSSCVVDRIGFVSTAKYSEETKVQTMGVASECPATVERSQDEPCIAL